MCKKEPSHSPVCDVGAVLSAKLTRRPSRSRSGCAKKKPSHFPVCVVGGVSSQNWQSDPPDQNRDAHKKTVTLSGLCCRGSLVGKADETTLPITIGMCKKKNRLILMKRFVMSGQQDSNLRPPAPKAGALAGLRHAPIIFGGEGGIRTPGTLSSTTV